MKFCKIAKERQVIKNNPCPFIRHDRYQKRAMPDRLCYFVSKRFLFIFLCRGSAHNGMYLKNKSSPPHEFGFPGQSHNDKTVPGFSLFFKIYWIDKFKIVYFFNSCQHG